MAELSTVQKRINELEADIRAHYDMLKALTLQQIMIVAMVVLGVIWFKYPVSWSVALVGFALYGFWWYRKQRVYDHMRELGQQLKVFRNVRQEEGKVNK